MRTSTVHLRGEGWQTVSLPWSAFNFAQADFAFLRGVKELSISAPAAQEKAAGSLRIRNVRVIRAPAVAIECEVRGRAAEQGAAAEYPVRVCNCTDVPASIALSFVKVGWEVMETSVEPAVLQLEPREGKRPRSTGWT